MAQPNGKHGQVEVQPRARRRTFTAAYKRRILAEADGCRRGQVGALLWREELYYSHLAKWRGEREAGTLADRSPIALKWSFLPTKMPKSRVNMMPGAIRNGI